MYWWLRIMTANWTVGTACYNQLWAQLQMSDEMKTSRPVPWTRWSLHESHEYHEYANRHRWCRAGNAQKVFGDHPKCRPLFTSSRVEIAIEHIQKQATYGIQKERLLKCTHNTSSAFFLFFPPFCSFVLSFLSFFTPVIATKLVRGKRKGRQVRKRGRKRKGRKLPRDGGRLAAWVLAVDTEESSPMQGVFYVYSVQTPVHATTW